MGSRKRNVLVLFDLPYAPPRDQDYSDLLKTEEFRIERDIARALHNSGHVVRHFGIYDSIAPLVDELSRRPPDVVFNQCESFKRTRELEANVISILELLNIPFTGAKPEALQLCKDKGMTKKVLAYHGVRVPDFQISSAQRPLKKVRRKSIFPGICKPLGREASEGIARASFVENEAACLDRLLYIHEKLGCDAIVEEYIGGREIYVGLIGTTRPIVLPAQELFFKQVPKNKPRIATYKAKWDKAYRKRWGIDSAKAKKIDAKTLGRINGVCKEIYHILKLSGYARIDLRLSEEGEVVFLEANPNPCIAKGDDFAAAAKQAGIGYDDLINKVLHLALA